MQLDYNANNPGGATFILRVPRGEADAYAIQREEGFNFSRTASTLDVAVLFTREPYAALAYFRYGTREAKAVLEPLWREVEASWAKESQAHIRVPEDQELAPFQKAGVEYAMRREHALIGDAPGLGKTPMAIALANEIGAEHVTVLCPASIRLQWAAKVQEWSTMRRPFYTYPIMKGENGVHPAANWTIVSYDLARTPAIGRALSRIPKNLLILDEAHYLKEATSQRARAVLGGGDNRDFEPIKDTAERVLALTGTPLPNRPREAYTLTRGLCFDAIDWMSEDRFRERFNPSQTKEIIKKDGTKVRVVDERTGRHSELQMRMRANFMVRREKHGEHGVGNQLGQMHIPVLNVVHVDETAAVRKVLQAESLLKIDVDNWEASLNDPDALGAIATLRRMMGEATAPFALDYIKTLLDGGEPKLFVVCYHTSVIEYLQQKLAHYGVRMIHGATTSAKRERAKAEFIADPKVRVFLANLITGGTGLDGLQQVCSHGVLAEPDWVHGNNQQVIDRLDRGGQRDHVQFDFLLVPGSLCEKVLAKAITKGQTVHKALDRRI